MKAWIIELTILHELFHFTKTNSILDFFKSSQKRLTVKNKMFSDKLVWDTGLAFLSGYPRCISRWYKIGSTDLHTPKIYFTSYSINSVTQIVTKYESAFISRTEDLVCISLKKFDLTS